MHQVPGAGGAGAFAPSSRPPPLRDHDRGMLRPGARPPDKSHQFFDPPATLTSTTRLPERHGPTTSRRVWRISGKLAPGPIPLKQTNCQWASCCLETGAIKTRGRNCRAAVPPRHRLSTRDHHRPKAGAAAGFAPWSLVRERAPLGALGRFPRRPEKDRQRRWVTEWDPHSRQKTSEVSHHPEGKGSRPRKPRGRGKRGGTPFSRRSPFSRATAIFLICSLASGS